MALQHVQAAKAEHARLTPRLTPPARHAPALNMCVRKVHPPQDLLRRVQTEAALQVAATTEAAIHQEVRRQAAVTTVAAHLREAHHQVQAVAQVAATAAEVAAQVRAVATPAQAAIAQAVVEVAARAAEEDKKIRPQSNKKTTFAAHLQGSLLI